MKDRRFCFRWQISKHTRVRLEGAECFCDCCVDNLNLKGMRISLPIKLKKDAPIKLSIFLADKFTLEVEAWVIWHKSIMDSNSYGLYFSRVRDSDRERLYNFVQRNYPAEIKKQFCYDGFEKGGEKMPESSFDDRRIFERFQIKCSLKYLNLVSNREGQGETRDISAKGVGVLTGEKLNVHTPLELWLRCPDRGEPLYSRGEVIWSSQVSPTEYMAGVNLEKANLMGLSRLIREA